MNEPDRRILFVGEPYTPEASEAHRRVMEWLDHATPEEVFQSCVRSGIYNPDGTLRPPYADEPEASGAK